MKIDSCYCLKQDLLDPDDYMIVKYKPNHQENPFIDQQPSPRKTLVDMKGNNDSFRNIYFNCMVDL